jgi:hypothetical protein
LKQRRFASAMLAVLYLVTASGIPLPAGNVTHKSGEYFPCSESPCGCASAEQCWRSCCCHSLAERLAWAREHGVRPPEFAIANARQAGLDVAWLVAKPGDGAKLFAASCSGHEMKTGTRSCCRAKASCCESHHDHDAQPTESKKSNRVVGWKVLNCQGHSTNWIAAVPTLVTSDASQSLDLSSVEWLGPATSESAERAADRPAIPPPRTVALPAVSSASA